MSEVSVAGIVLRRRDAGESDRRLTILTGDLGKIEVTAKGARKAASRLTGVSEPLCAAHFGLATGKRSYFVTQAQPTSSFRKLRGDYDRLSFALALVELYAAVIPQEEPNAEPYALLSASLAALESHPRPIVSFVWAETVLLALSGFQPVLTECLVCGKRFNETEGRVSPQAGGFLCANHWPESTDSFPVSGEVLIGISRIAELPAPPENLKYAVECIAALFPFWRTYADSTLSANASLVNHLNSERISQES